MSMVKLSAIRDVNDSYTQFMRDKLFEKYGDIEYNDEDFGLQPNGNDCYLIYKGSETDGSKIKLPDGIKSMDYMFFCSDIEMPPIIPNTVESMNYTFSGCIDLKKSPEIPNSVRSMVSTFRQCDSLEELPVLPAGIMHADGSIAQSRRFSTDPDDAPICDAKKPETRVNRGVPVVDDGEAENDLIFPH